MANRSRADGYHHGDLKNALVAAARELVEAHGAEAFSLRQAAVAVGVTPSAAYRHFENRDALLAGVAVTGFAELATRMEEARDRVRFGRRSTLPRRRFAALGRAYVAMAVEMPELFRLMFGRHGAGSDRDVRGIGPSGLDPYELLEAGVAELEEAGLSRSAPDHAVLAAWSAVHGLATLLVDGPLPAEDYLAATDRVIATLLDGLLRPQ